MMTWYSLIQKPDILECEVKWALGIMAVNKAGRNDGIPAELFEILTDEAIKVLHSICQQVWKAQQWPQVTEMRKMSIFIPIPQKDITKEYSNHQTIALIFHSSKVMLKILHTRLQHYIK